MKLKTWSRPQNAFSLSLLNVNYDCVHCLDQNSSLALSLIPSYPHSFFPTLLVLPHLVNSSFFILCISSLNLQLVPKFNGASMFILPCHPSASQLLPLLPPCLPQFLQFPFPLPASGAPPWDLFLFFCTVSFSCTWMIHFFCSHLPLSVILLAVPTSPQGLFWGAPGGFFQLPWSQWPHPEFHGIHFYPTAYLSLPLHQNSPIWSAIINFPQTFRISKFNPQLDVSFPTSMFFHRQISPIFQGMLFSPISLLVHFHLLGFTSTEQKNPWRLSSCFKCASV